MTAFNVALSPRRDLACIVVDTATMAANGGVSHYAAKLLPIAHAGAVLAWAGASGVGQELARFALAGMLNDSTAEILDSAPGFLRDIWGRTDWRWPSRIILAGSISRTSVACYEMRSDLNFEPRELVPGTYFAPPLGVRPGSAKPLMPAASRETIEPPAPLQTVEAPTSDLCWHDMLRDVIAAVPRQQREGSTLIAGQIVRCLVSPDWIDLRVVGALPEPGC